MEPVIIGADREYETVCIDDLRADAYSKTDTGYQRDLNSRKVKSITGKYNELLRSELTVSRRVGGPDEGQLFVVDGQHTLESLRNVYPPGSLIRVPVRRLTQDEEREIFTRQGENRSSPGIVDIFKVNLRAGKEKEVAINRAVEESGAELNFIGNADGNRITAIGTVVKIYDRLGEAALRRAIRFLIRTYPDELTVALEGRVIQGLANVMVMHPKLTDRDIYDRLKKHASSPKTLTADGASVSQIGQRILNAYNYGRPRDRGLTYDLVALSRNAAKLTKDASK